MIDIHDVDALFEALWANETLARAAIRELIEVADDDQRRVVALALEQGVDG